MGDPRSVYDLFSPLAGTYLLCMGSWHQCHGLRGTIDGLLLFSRAHSDQGRLPGLRGWRPASGWDQGPGPSLSLTLSMTSGQPRAFLGWEGVVEDSGFQTLLAKKFFFTDRIIR